MSDLISRNDVIRILEECHLDKVLFEKDVFDKINALPVVYNREMVNQAMRKLTPRKVKKILVSGYGPSRFYCPVCHKQQKNSYRYMKNGCYCERCGQALEWKGADSD